MKKDKKIIILSSIIIGVLVVVLGFTYAAFTFDRNGANQELVLGDIWMKYTETNGISLEGAFPGADYSKYFEFTITGKNTYTEKDIWYDIRLTKGSVPTGKIEDNRIEDKYLKFKLVEVNGNTETEILKDVIYEDLTNQTIHVATIPKGTNSYSKTYRLYMVISENLKVGNVEGAMSSEEFENLFGSIKVATTGDFEEKTSSSNSQSATLSDTFKGVLLTRTNSYVLEDDIYYVSGAKDDNNLETTDDIDFNYVWYSGKLWRITAINPDGSLKLITEDNITSIAYGEDINFYTNETTTSWVYQWLNEDFLDTLYNYEDIIETNYMWNATATPKTSGGSSSAPSVPSVPSVPGVPGATIEMITVDTKLPATTMVPAKVGLLNSYEYYMSYKNVSSSNGYLKNYVWWLLNPYSVSDSRIWFVGVSTALNDDLSRAYGLRPSINLKSTIKLVGGSGIKSDPYRIKGDKEDVVPNTTLLNTRTSGEYVNFDGELYRIVGIENGTTKINKVDYIRDENDAVITKKFASTVTFGLDTNTQSEDYWDYYLNNTWSNSINSNYKSMLVKGTYYLGIIGMSSRNYKLAICATASNTITTKDCTKTSRKYSGYVGLPRYGEMFSTQLGSGVSSSSDMWLITPPSMSYVIYVSSNGEASSTSPSSTFALRPSINLKSTIVIKSGSGTLEDPFEVSLP